MGNLFRAPIAFVIPLLFTSIASADETISPRFSTTAYPQVAARVASDGTDYLAAWTVQNTNLGSAVYAQLVRSDGSLPGTTAQPLDPLPGPLWVPTSPHGVSVTAGRDGFFAAWVSTAGVSAAIMDHFGRVEHRTTVPTANQKSTIAAWNGAAYLVLTTSDGPFSATVFDVNGNPVQSDLPIGNTYGDTGVALALTTDSNGFLVLSTRRAGDHDDLYGRHVSSAGSVGEWFLIRSITPGVRGLAAASDGTNVTLAWGTDFGVWMTALGPQTNAAAPARQLIGDSASVAGVVSNGGRTWITYANWPCGSAPCKVFVIGIASDGSAAAPVEIGAPAASDAYATNGSNLLRVYTSNDASGLPTLYAAFAANGAAQPSFPIARSETDQQRASLAPGADQLLMVWDENVTAERQVFAARLRGAGSVIDTAGIQLSTSGSNTNAAAAFSGNAYLVVWQHETSPNRWQTVGRRISMDGQVLDSADLVIFENATGRPRVIWDGSNWLVVSTRGLAGVSCSNNYGVSRVYASHVSLAGALLDNGVPISDSGSGAVYDQKEPDVVWTGADYVFAWANYCAGFHNPVTTWIAAARVNRDLTSVQPVTVTPKGSVWLVAPFIRYSSPRVVARTDGGLIAWQRTFNGEEGVEYVTFADALPQLARRRRSVSASGAFRSVPGKLIKAVASPSHAVLITESSASTSPYSYTLIQPDGTAGPMKALGGYVNAVLDDSILLPNGERASVYTSFDPAAGSSRLLLGADYPPW